MLHTKHFSLSEAKKILPVLQKDLSEIIELKKKLDEDGYDIYRHHYFGGIGPNGTGKFPKDLERLIELVEKISSKGILIKGIDDGLIDFPHIRENGEEVYLCYLCGEDDIEFWHTVYEGFAGRKSIEDL